MTKFLPILIFYSLLCHTLSAQAPDTLFFYNDSIYQLDEVEISAVRKPKAISGSMSGRMDLKIKELQSLPKFLGTVDLLRTIQLTPGIQTSGEANSGLYIRGSESGHNQVLLNGATIYNPMHLLGFFSIFNGDHLDKTSLHKSYIAPQYGGRLSGTVDVSSKTEQVERTSVKGTIGLISSQATIETPVGKKSSLYVSGRGTYVNLLLGMIDMSQSGIQPRYGFQDYNLTYTVQPDEKNRIVANAYFGKDALSIDEYYYQVNGKVNWQNATASLQWVRQLSDGKQLTQTAHYSYYDNDMHIMLGGTSIRMPSGIQDFGYKGDYRFRLLGGYWNVGGDYTYHHTNPQYPETKDLFSIGENEKPRPMNTHEYGVYAQARFMLSSQWETQLGLRYSGSGTYNGLEPRFSLSYEWKPERKFILAYTLQRQYMNQVVVSGIGLPTDFWLPASESVPAQYAHSASLGYVQSLFEDDYEFSVEGYYKYLGNQLEFNGELFNMVNQAYHIEDHLFHGKGQAYGVEFMFKKNTGRLNGWLSYTLGKSTRRFPDINNGAAFAAKNDRRHDLSVVVNWKLNERWDLSGVFVYATGNAFTMPTALYLIGENAVNEYGPHNGARMPAYHRMDLSAGYWFVRNSKRESMINISLYNAYARPNPIFLTVKVKPSEDKRSINIKPIGQSLYSLVPSISYSFKF